jgi:hypothetical protein
MGIVFMEGAKTTKAEFVMDNRAEDPTLLLNAFLTPFPRAPLLFVPQHLTLLFAKSAHMLTPAAIWTARTESFIVIYSAIATLDMGPLPKEMVLSLPDMPFAPAPKQTTRPLAKSTAKKK